MPTNSDVQLLANYCHKNLDLGHIELGEEYGYMSLPLCVIDAIFSIGVTYTSTRNTVNRFCSYLNTHIDGFSGQTSSDLKLSVSDFVQLYRDHSLEFMTKQVYQNSQRTSARNGILKAEAVLKVAELLLRYDVDFIEDMQKVVNNPAFEAEFKQIPGQASGISLRYFYMLTGIKTEIKPDRMVIRFIEAALGRSVKVDECHGLLVETCQLLLETYPDLNPRSLDHAVWQFQQSQ